jgi:bifunctional non-homologous end joining protein LigD
VALRSSRAVSASRLRGARKAALPGYIELCDPALRQRAPKGDWWFEIKADGYRAQLHIRPDGAQVFSRTGLDWTDQFSSIAAASHELKVTSAVIDGEAVIMGRAVCPTFRSCGANWELGRVSGCDITLSICATRYHQSG